MNGGMLNLIMSDPYLDYKIINRINTSVDKLEKKINKILGCIEMLTRIDELENAIKYMPLSEEYNKAKNEFESLKN